jgi:hypothetical protein
VSLFCLSACAGQTATPQARPDFSGHWTFDAVKTKTDGTGTPFNSEMSMLIAQDSTSMKITHPGIPLNDARPVTYTFGEQHQTSSALGHTDIPATNKVSWIGNKLVDVTTLGPVTITRTYTMESTWLVVRTTAIGQTVRWYYQRA